MWELSYSLKQNFNLQSGHVESLQTRYELGMLWTKFLWKCNLFISLFPFLQNVQSLWEEVPEEAEALPAPEDEWTVQGLMIIKC